MENLKGNRLVDEVDAGRLAAHYRFLSGYAHPVVDHRRELYGRQALPGWPKYDHYSSELVLLYAITLGALELTNFKRTLDQAPGAHSRECRGGRTSAEGRRVGNVVLLVPRCESSCLRHLEDAQRSRVRADEGREHGASCLPRASAGRRSVSR